MVDPGTGVLLARALPERYLGALDAFGERRNNGPMDSPGRNAPCPCGSGKKYKLCCMGGKSTGEVAASDGQFALCSDPMEGVLFPAPPDSKTKSLEAPTAPPRASRIDQRALDAIDEALANLQEVLLREQGLVAVVRKHAYTRWNDRIELEVSVQREDGVLMDRLAVAFLERCLDYGLRRDDLGRSFRLNGKHLRVIGLRPRSKAPVVCEQLSPKLAEPTEILVPPSVVRHLLHECPKRDGAKGQS